MTTGVTSINSNENNESNEPEQQANEAGSVLTAFTRLSAAVGRATQEIQARMEQKRSEEEAEKRALQKRKELVAEPINRELTPERITQINEAIETMNKLLSAREERKRFEQLEILGIQVVERSGLSTRISVRLTRGNNPFSIQTRQAMSGEIGEIESKTALDIPYLLHVDPQQLLHVLKDNLTAIAQCKPEEIARYTVKVN